MIRQLPDAFKVKTAPEAVWKEYERIHSDVFDHLLVMVQKFDLKLYQYSD